MNKQEPIQEGETWRATAETTERMAARCRLNVAQYEQQVLLPAIRAAEKKANLRDEVPLLHWRAMRAAGTAGFRTARGLRRWIENVTWRWRRGYRTTTGTGVGPTPRKSNYRPLAGPYGFLHQGGANGRSTPKMAFVVARQWRLRYLLQGSYRGRTGHVPLFPPLRRNGFARTGA